MAIGTTVNRLIRGTATSMDHWVTGGLPMTQLTISEYRYRQQGEPYGAGRVIVAVDIADVDGVLGQMIDDGGAVSERPYHVVATYGVGAGGLQEKRVAEDKQPKNSHSGRDTAPLDATTRCHQERHASDSAAPPIE